MANPTYSTGTVSINNGDTIVVGTSTIWSGVNAKAGDSIQIGTLPPVDIKDVTDTTHLTLWAPWTGGAQAAATYTIIQNYPTRVVGVAAAEDVGTMLGQLNSLGPIFNVPSTATVPDPSYGADGQYAIQMTTGKWWLKSGGVWGLVTAPIAGYGGTSATSLVIGTGTKAFTTQANLAYNGARVRAASAAAPANYMEGVCTYSGSTLTMTVDTIDGSGTKADWVFAIAGTPGGASLTSSNTFTAGPQTISPPANTLTQGLSITQSGPTSGSTVGPVSYNLITLTDSGNTVTSSGRDAFDLFGTVSSGFRVNATHGGTEPPIRIAGTFASNYTGSSALAETVGVIGSTYSNATVGALWGNIGYSSVGPAGTAAALIPVTAEVSAQTGSTVTRRVGFLAITEAPVQGSTLDAAFVVSAEDVGHGTPGGFKNVIAISNNWWSHAALDSSANFFSADSATTIANWANMSNVTVTGDILSFPNVNLPGAASGFTLPTPAAGTIFQFGGIQAGFEADTFLGSAKFIGKRADGSSTAPSAVQSGEGLVALAGDAHDGTGYSEVGLIGIYAAQNFTSANHGTYLSVFTTPLNSTTEGEVVRVQQGVMVGTTTDPGAGIVNVATGFRIGNAATSGNVLRGNGTNFVSSALAVADVTGAAPLASPVLTGTPTAPTATPGTNTTQIATAAFVQAAVTALIGGAPGALDTLKELADAINDDSSFAATITTALGLKAPLASPALTGTPTAPTAAVDTNTTQLATTAMVLAQAASATPLIAAAAAAVGTSTRFARADHVHPFDNTAWTSYTPTVTSSSGTATTVSATGRYKQIGKTVFLTISVTITAVGTAAGQIFATLPTNASGSGFYIGTAYESSTTGNTGAAAITLGQPSRVQSAQYGGATWWVNGYIVNFSVTYETP